MIPTVLRLAKWHSTALLTAAWAALAISGCSQQQPEAPPPQATTTPNLAVKVLNASYYAILADKPLKDFVRTTAENTYTRNCASCHGADFKGKPGVPDLTDYDWLWGTGGEEESDVSNVMSIQQTILYGIRNQDCPASNRKERYGACPDTRYSSMVGFGKTQALNDAQIKDLVEYMQYLSKQPADAAAVKRARKTFAVDCIECHGKDAFGVKPYGGPNLTDDIWLYGSDRDTAHDVIFNGREGACPPWGEKLDAATIKALAVYLYGKTQEEF